MRAPTNYLLSMTITVCLSDIRHKVVLTNAAAIAEMSTTYHLVQHIKAGF